MEQIARTPIQLGAVLRRRRKTLGLSQADLGRRINLRQATVSALESGEVDTKLTTLMDALAALNLELVVRPRSAGGGADIEAMF
ncbi:MAG TPA: helix-turn-helix transcriptional regulator [Caulobacteraceae bacterium]|jgi:HTH-type transcriptional regulator/antitoxin HipB|nr:helix-turn-helix transcriptional regulator [Caulobacteraceae bacterium]